MSRFEVIISRGRVSVNSRVVSMGLVSSTTTGVVVAAGATPG